MTRNDEAKYETPPSLVAGSPTTVGVLTTLLVAALLTLPFTSGAQPQQDLGLATCKGSSRL